MNFISMDARQALADLDDPRASIPIKRSVAADLVAALIDFLDETELDADLEPSLAGFNVGQYEPLRGGYDLEPDCDEDDDTENEPLLGWTEQESRTGRTAESTYAGGYLDGEVDDDDEPSLGSAACSAPTVNAFGWLKVRPYYLTEAAWAAHLAEQRGEAVAVYAGSQETWSDGRRDDREDEHDGTEPENEHGPSWAEGAARGGSLFSGSNEDDEPSLSLTEHTNQETRLRGTNDFFVEDAEADYVDRFGRPRIADDRESANEDGGDVQDEPHDEEPDREVSAGFDTADACTTEWTPDRPVEEYVGSGSKFGPVRNKTTQRQKLRQTGTGHQGRFHGLILNAMPERYIMQVEGSCLEPEIRNGARLEFSSKERPREGDFVAIYRFAQFVKPGEWQVVVKRLVWDARKGSVTPCWIDPKTNDVISLGHGVEARMLNPPRKLFYPAQEVEAVHKVVRILPDGERGVPMSAGGIAIMGLAQ